MGDEERHHGEGTTTTHTEDYSNMEGTTNINENSNALLMRTLPSVRIIKSLPKASRNLAAKKLAHILNDAVLKNDDASWHRLFRFSRRCLRSPGRTRKSLASIIKRQLHEEVDTHTDFKREVKEEVEGLLSWPFSLSYVSEKLKDGDYKGALRILSSDDSLAPESDATYQALLDLYPQPHTTPQTIPTISGSVEPIAVSEEEVLKGVMSFRKGLAGGPDGLTPQHLQEMLTQDSNEKQALLSALTAFTQLVLKGKIPTSVRPFFFGSKITAIQTEDETIRPIVMGCILRRLAAKVAGRAMIKEMSELLTPRQLGFGVSNGAEAAVHATRLYLQDIDPMKVVLKVAFRNAFSCISREHMLSAIFQYAPKLYPLVYSTYSSPSLLLWCDKSILSHEGIQKGDPLGLLLFCVCIHSCIAQLQSELVLFHLDNGTLGGTLKEVCHDFECIKDAGKSYCLEVDERSTEVIFHNEQIADFFSIIYPEMKLVRPSEATLFESSIDVSPFNLTLQTAVDKVRRVSERLEYFESHEAVAILKYAHHLPKLHHLLRTSPCFHASELLKEYDSIVRYSLQTQIERCDLRWPHTAQQVNNAEEEIRSIVQLAPMAFLSTAKATSHLVYQIVPPILRTCSIVFKIDAMAELFKAYPQEKDYQNPSVWGSESTQTISSHGATYKVIDDFFPSHGQMEKVIFDSTINRVREPLHYFMEYTADLHPTRNLFHKMVKQYKSYITKCTRERKLVNESVTLTEKCISSSMSAEFKAYCMGYHSIVLTHAGMTWQAMTCLMRALELLHCSKDNSSDNFKLVSGRTYRLLARAHRTMKDYEKAKEYALRSRNELKNAVLSCDVGDAELEYALILQNWYGSSVDREEVRIAIEHGQHCVRSCQDLQRKRYMIPMADTQKALFHLHAFEEPLQREKLTPIANKDLQTAKLLLTQAQEDFIPCSLYRVCKNIALALVSYYEGHYTSALQLTKEALDISNGADELNLLIKGKLNFFSKLIR